MATPYPILKNLAKNLKHDHIFIMIHFHLGIGVLSYIGFLQNMLKIELETSECLWQKTIVAIVAEPYPQTRYRIYWKLNLGQWASYTTVK